MPASTLSPRTEDPPCPARIDLIELGGGPGGDGDDACTVNHAGAAVGICEKICKYQAITPASRADGKTLSRCTLCRDCIGSCAEKAIFIHFPGLAPERAWLFLSGLTTVLHVLFLSVAMA